jgi:glycosyltransferase involved in cell wall biosynthesis
MGTASAEQVWRDKGWRGPSTILPQFGVDPVLFHPQVRPPNPIPVVGFIGRLVPEKGVDLLLRAFATLTTPARLQIIGQGQERDALQALATTLGIADRVTFIPQMPSTQMPATYPQLDLLVIPSRTLPTWKEQFGRVIIEAMACGVPVLGSDSAAIPDVIGDAGEIFPEGDEYALQQALTHLLTDADRRAELSQRGRERVVKQFTHQQVAAQTVAVYREVMRNHQRV